MDTEKSSSSSFEDLTNAEDTKDIRKVAAEAASGDGTAADNAATQTEKLDTELEESDAECDILGNKQLIKRTIKRAPKEAKTPERGDLVTINFTGKLDSGKVVEHEEGFQCHVGDYEIVQGLDMVLPMLQVGEVAQVSVDPRFGYGSIGLKKESDSEVIVPSDANVCTRLLAPLNFIKQYVCFPQLTYEIELVSVKNEDFADLKSFEIRRKYGTRKKERANFFYKRLEYNTAICLYKRALDFLDTRDGDPDADFDHEDLELSNSDTQILLDDRLIVYNNLAMTQIKIAAYDAALESVEHVLRCQPNNSKALYRKGRILEGKMDTQGAIKLLQKVATLEPENRAVQSDLARLFIKARREEHNEKEMYQKMLGQAKKMEQKTATRQKQPLVDNSKLKLLGYLMGSILIGVAGVAIYRYKY
ncbi:hypothetical protein KR018_011951 [Drosophila ironensis]|nr:hypothetical protein KR018_011951 [Drosophila ironensis]